MFRKVQLKFFGIITAILIAIFIGVLSSINIIMDVIMERQTKVVLQQVASGVEYNSANKTFTYKNTNKPKDEPFKYEKPTVAHSTKSTESIVTTTAVATDSVKSVSTTIVVQTAPPVEATNPPETEAEINPPTDNPMTNPPIIEVLPPEPTNPPETAPPFISDDNPKPTEPNPWGNQWETPNPWYNPWYPWYNPWGNPWYNPNGGQYENDDDNDDDREDNYNRIGPVAYSDFAPVLDGYTISVEKNVQIADNNSEDTEPVPKSLGSIEFFVIMADSDGKFTASANNDSMTAELGQQYIDEILNNKENLGMTRNHSYCAEKKSNGTLMVLTDRTAEIEMMKKLKRTTLIVGIISVILLSVASYFLSGLIVKPLKETFERQKQFISDASHELKTPLTVISTNADVLEGEIGQNRWLNYIHDQADRMNVLVNDLLSLSRLENSNRDFITCEFDLSRAVTNASLPFECQAFESKKNFVLNIEEGIRINGSEQHIKQMTGIFIDNALKYSKDSGTVRVSLTKEDNKAVLAVYNTGHGVREEEVDKLFERFYRSDESRNRSTGGYGLGLAIAKSIIDKHKFKVHIENQEGRSICFVVTMLL